MTAPSLAASYIADLWTNSTSPRSTASFSRSVGDVLIAVVGFEDQTAINCPPGNVTGVTWSNPQTVTTASRCKVAVYTAVVTQAGTGAITFTESGATTLDWGARVYHWTGSAGVGTSNKGDAADSAASVTLTGVLANSAIVMIITDWEAGNPTLAYRTADAGAFTEVDHVDDGNLYTVYSGYHADAGASGNKVVGFTTTTPDWSLIAVEVKGTAGQTISLTQPSETETSQAISVDKNVALGQPSETETAQSVAPKKNVTLAQPSETETAQAVTVQKIVALGQVTEIETAQSIATGAPQFISLGQVAETETAQAVTAIRTVALGQNSETETSQSVTAKKNVALAQPSETETAQSFTAKKFVALGQVTETESPQTMGVGGTQQVPLGQPSELEASQTVSIRKVVLLGQPSESEAAQTFTARKTVLLGQAVETEQVLSIAGLVLTPGTGQVIYPWNPQGNVVYLDVKTLPGGTDQDQPPGSVAYPVTRQLLGQAK